MVQGQSVDARDIAFPLARKLLGNRLRHIERMPEGLMNFMFRISTDSGPAFVLRLYPAERYKVAAYEPQLIRRCSDEGCRVPNVVEFCDTLTDGDCPPFVLYEYIAGQTLTERQHHLSKRNLRTVAVEVIDNLKAMGRLRFERFGGLVSAYAADSPTAMEFFSRSFARGTESARLHGTLDTELVESIERAAQRIDVDMNTFDGELAWGDLAPSNILIGDDYRLAGLVDFESSFVFDRTLSFGYLFAMQPDSPLLAALLAAAARNGLDLDEEKLRLCAVLRLVRMARFAHRDLPSGVRQRALRELFPGAVRAVHGLVGR